VPAAYSHAVEVSASGLTSMTTDFLIATVVTIFAKTEATLPCSGPVCSRGQKANFARLLAAVNSCRNTHSKRRQIFQQEAATVVASSHRNGSNATCVGRHLQGQLRLIPDTSVGCGIKTRQSEPTLATVCGDTIELDEACHCDLRCVVC